MTSQVSHTPVTLFESNSKFRVQGTDTHLPGVRACLLDLLGVVLFSDVRSIAADSYIIGSVSKVGTEWLHFTL